jgi:hypothetical protein
MKSTVGVSRCSPPVAARLAAFEALRMIFSPGRRFRVPYRHSVSTRLSVPRMASMNRCIVCFFCLFPLLAVAQGATSPPSLVIVAEVRVDRFVDRVEALGTLKANESIRIRSWRINGVRLD